MTYFRVRHFLSTGGVFFLSLKVKSHVKAFVEVQAILQPTRYSLISEA